MLSDYLNQRLSFDTAAPGVLGSARNGATLVAMLDFGTASLFGDMRAKHTAVKTAIAGLPDSPTSYMYAKFRYADGTEEVLGEPWIVANSIKAVVIRKILIEISENVTENTEALVRAALTQNGIQTFKLTTSA